MKMNASMTCYQLSSECTKLHHVSHFGFSGEERKSRWIASHRIALHKCGTPQITLHVIISFIAKNEYFGIILEHRNQWSHRPCISVRLVFWQKGRIRWTRFTGSKLTMRATYLAHKKIIDLDGKNKRYMQALYMQPININKKILNIIFPYWRHCVLTRHRMAPCFCATTTRYHISLSHQHEKIKSFFYFKNSKKF